MLTLNRKKELIGICALAAITIASLVACGSKQEVTPVAPSQPQPSVASPAEPSQQSVAPPSGAVEQPQSSQPSSPSTPPNPSAVTTEPATEPTASPEIAKAEMTESSTGSGTETDATDMKESVADEQDGAGSTEPVIDLDEVDALDEAFFLEILSPEEDPAFVESPSVAVFARTRVDAAVSVNDDLVDVDADGILEATVDLEEGPNVIEVVASVDDGQEESAVLTVFYIP